MTRFLTDLIALCNQHGDRLTLDQIEAVLVQMLERVRTAKDDRTLINKAVDEAAKNPIS